MYGATPGVQPGLPTGQTRTPPAGPMGTPPLELAWVTGETSRCGLKMVGFSCSSKRTSSVMPRFALLATPAQLVGVTPLRTLLVGPVTPSRQMRKLVLNAETPPSIQRAANRDGSG